MDGIDQVVIDFLQQSNYIEQEPTNQALDDAVVAWKYIITKPTINLGRILHLHRLLMETRTTIDDKEKGSWRTGPVWIGSREAPKYYAVPELMKAWVDFIKTPPTGKVADDWFKECHIRFEHVHPFFDGNGRVGRILFNWQRVKAGLPVMVIREEDRYEYYKWFK